MRYSKGAASLLSTVFTFPIKSVVVVANIFDPIYHDNVGAIAPTKNKTGFGSEDKVALTNKLRQKCNDGHDDEDCTPGHGREHLAPTNSHAADAGILDTLVSADKGTDGTPSSGISIAASTCDPADIVDCYNGIVRGSNPAISCHERCNKSCCTYHDVYYSSFEDACSGFTGKVCKDESCNGKNACTDATIPSVINSCKDYESCFHAGYNAGLIKSMVDSCDGRRACFYAAAGGGSIGSIVNSCHGDYSCDTAAEENGSIGDITESCVGEGACDDLGNEHGKVGNVVKSCHGERACIETADDFGLIGSISGSCIGDYSCREFGSYFGTVGDLSNACTGKNACHLGAMYGGIIASIVNSCTADHSCRLLGHGAGKIGNVKDSCTALDSCRGAGYNRGSMGSITTSCNAEAACRDAGTGSSGAITSNLKGCCNTVSACELATQSTLPAQCNSKVRKYDEFALKLATCLQYNSIILCSPT